MIKTDKVFAHYISHKFPSRNINITADKAYKFQVKYAAPERDCGELALRSLKVNGYLPDIDLEVETAAWNVYLASYKLEAEKTSLEYRLIQLENEMAELKQAMAMSSTKVGTNNSSMSELTRKVGIYMEK
jgi:hypothetical protein